MEKIATATERRRIMTTPNNTYDVIVIGAGISGRYNWLKMISPINLDFVRRDSNVKYIKMLR